MKKPNKKSAAGILIVFFAIVAIWVIPANFEIVPNYSESLPYKWVLVKKGLIPSKRDQVFVFYVRDNKQLGVEKIKFIKLVGGLSGDELEVRGGDFVVGDKILQGEELGDDSMYHAIRFEEITNPDYFQKKGFRITDKEVYVNGKSIGIVKPFSKKLLPALEFARNKKEEKFSIKEFSLNAIDAGKIPTHKFFAYTPHKDSFDSRYQEIGLIDEKDIIGTAILTF